MTRDYAEGWTRHKLASCVRLARDCNREFLVTKDPRLRRVRIEAMADARYWQRYLHAL